ncbi:MAG: VOC family protein [Verrucomicrobia bacterium]|nr:VOC family protein [Verrucomicrobiota bacterium]MBI3867886.1 VOC family protein [Verrucomicrobiota bacterium]
MPNPIIRWQIVSPEPDKAANFYRKLFQWKLSKANAMGYRELKTETKSVSPVDGGVWPSPPGQGSMAQLFIEVADVDACVARATKLGAKVIVPKSVLPDGDTMAVLLDPVGLSFGVCRLKG